MNELNPNQSERLHPLLVKAVAQTLHAIFRDGVYADKAVEQALKWNPKAGSRDRAFIAETTYEIVRFYRLYEVVFGRAPVSQDDFWRMTGIHFIRQGRELPDWMEYRGLHPAQVLEELEELSSIRKIRESVSDWMDDLGIKELGEVWEQTLPYLNQPAKLVLRCNALKATRAEAIAALAEEKIEADPFGDENAIVLRKRHNIFQTQAFKKGMFEVQDYSSQQVAAYLAPQPGMRVVDACAGGGGKTLHLAALLQNKGSIIALDTLAWKLDELKIRARRAGASNIETRPIDTTKVVKRLYGTADRLLLDVPCSGLGVLRRNPDSKWKLTEAFVDKLRGIQQQILQSYSPITKPGGMMVYATCSILPSENQDQVAKFLASDAGKDFTLLKDSRILPQDNGFDGFYMALLQRNA